MVQFTVFILLLIIFVVLLIVEIVYGISWIVRRSRKTFERPSSHRLKKNSLFLLGVVVLIAISLSISQYSSRTPQNYGDEGITELREIKLNGRSEWISIRGAKKDNPILLFLAGGPGGSQMAAVRHEIGELEQHFIVVNWDQPGSGKSYDAIASDKLTIDTYIEDGLALTEYLTKTFKQEKIYLVGESWGSALGIFLAERKPERYHAFIGTGQMVDFLETEIIDYEKAMEIAKKKDDTKKIEALKENGLPPYERSDVTWKSAEYLNYLTTEMNENPKIQNSGYNTVRDILSLEYGIIDKVNFIRGITNTFNYVYPQLYDIDLRESYTKLEVPVYFFLGKHDINAPISLSEEYFKMIQAPQKEMVWFEHSGHSPWINESEKFVQELVQVKEAYSPSSEGK